MRGVMMKQVILQGPDGERVIGRADSWGNVHELCRRLQLDIDQVGSEGPAQFYVTIRARRIRAVLNPTRPLPTAG